MINKQKKSKKPKKPVVLLILDGWGIAPANRGNTITLAKTPVMNELKKKYSHMILQAAGKAVGLPPGQVGNSEAGHMNLGAGRVVEQDAVKISKSINQGLFFKNSAFLKAIDHVKKNNSALHLIGMLSNGQSPHSDPDHLYALFSLVRHYDLKKVYLHLFTDGRDSPPFASLKLVEALMRILKKEFIATVMGRFYAMDRKKSWTRTMMAYDAMVLGSGLKAKSPQAAITQSYNRKETDEFIPPYVMTKNNKAVATVKDKDGIIFFNLRSDRARQLAKVFVQKEFEKMNPGSFRRKKVLKKIFFVAMTDFGPDLDHIVSAYPSDDLFDTLPMALSGMKQLYIAETEKYAHITYFFNGGYPDPVAGEKRIKIDSPDVKSYDETPEMSARKITKYVLNEIDNYDFILINFANPDMIGHTGNLEAGIKAVEFIDKKVGQIKEKVLKKDGILVITADHGNIEKMIDLDTNEIYTEHTTNPVPFMIVSNKKYKLISKKNAALSSVAPTILKLYEIKKPKAMTGESLIAY